MGINTGNSDRRVLFSVFFAVALVGLAACDKGQEAQTAQNLTADPASGNLAPVADQTPAPNDAAPNDAASYNDQQTVQAPEPPPPLPQYSQPKCPGENYIWNPGYWGYAQAGYYWVPGTWVPAPYAGALWTPPYWAYSGNDYVFYAGYWGPYIGFYGGINYGFGYTGRGYYGGYWNNGTVYYNQAVTNVNSGRVHNVYNYNVSAPNSRVSYNGGHGGINARPTAPELAAQRGQRSAPVPAQLQHAREAAGNRSQFAAATSGRPATLAAERPLPTTSMRPETNRPAQPNRQAQPEARSVPQENRPLAQVRPEAPRPENVPQARTPFPQNKPAPQQARPAEARPAPAARPELAARPAPEARPAPAAHPEEERKK